MEKSNSIYRDLNDFQKKMILYFKTEYPDKAKTFVPQDLGEFVDFSIVSNIEYDILINSNTYFKQIKEK